MTDISTAPALERSRRGSGLNRVLFVDTLMGSTGLFALLPVLGVLLAAGAGAAVVGIGLFSYTAAAGLSSLVVNRWLPGVNYRVGMVGSVVLTALAFGLLPYVRDPVVLCVLLVLAALGVSVHFVLSRVLIAEVVRDDIGRNRLFSRLQIAVNAGASAGPFVAGLLYANADPRVLLGVVSGCYLLAAATLLVGLADHGRPPPGTNGWPVSRATLRAVLRTPDMWRTVAIGTLGSLVYGQFYSAFALLVAHEVDSVGLRSVLLAGPAMLIVVAQAGVTGVVSRLLRTGARAFVLLAIATLIFGAALLILGAGPPLVVCMAATVVAFSIAEMLFWPMFSTAFAGLPLHSKLEAFNLRQISQTTGEACGAFLGGSLFLTMHLAGQGRLYWLLLGGLTILVTMGLARSAGVITPSRTPPAR
ncbi:MFS transporter [Actinophytocola sp.]|uniref:MFS transporter n=1 Tax=Actinophytocola sp. TaxID=1872138 RepID=UPI002D7F2FFF|nr:MFS transporter [Actinophytocola sp.]HET9143232.1 MFS transporter [Actinophytocola sp.]